MKGIIIFYIGVGDLEMTEHQFLEIIRSFNAQMIGKLENQGYASMFVPVRNESSRVEKVDFDLPHPRFVLPYVDVAESDKILEEIKNRALKEAEQLDV